MKLVRNTNIKIPKVPNFLVIYQGEEIPDATLSISIFDDEALENIVKQWTEQLKKRAREIRGELNESA